MQILANTLGIDPAQLRFIICQLIAIFMGFALRKLIPSSIHSSKKRHFYEAVVGIFILYICYGPRIIHLFIQALPAYLMLVLLPLPVAQYGILVFAMVYLSSNHIHQLFGDGQHVVDISGPLMVQTQKLSSLAFNINDGVKLAAGKGVARPIHQVHSINKRPRLLQLCGYLYCFHGCMIGPFMFFADYLKFIEGNEEERLLTPEDREKFMRKREEILKGRNEMWRQTRFILLHTILTICSLKFFKPEYLVSEEFASSAFLKKYFWLTVYAFAFRQKYYFAWTISCIANLAAGFGFSGFDKDGKPEYRLAINIYFLPIELATSTKEAMDAWNTGTTAWLRECIYDRAPSQYAVWLVFAVSAMWHGFDAGYYLAFITAALLTVCGRVCRRYLRPYFVTSAARHRFYDLLTTVCTMFCLNYVGVAFVLRRTNKVLFFWSRMNYLAHIIPLVLIICLPLITAGPRAAVVPINTPEQTPLEDKKKD